MKVLITGASGTIGNYLVKYLTGNGISVVGIDTEHFKFQQYTNYIFESCNILDKKKLSSIFEKHNPTHIIHLAYVMIPKHNKKIEDEIDITGSLNILELSNKTMSVKQFIFFSSASIYGPNEDNPEWLTEDSFVRPGEWVYAQNKAIIEDNYNDYDIRYDLKLVILRLCTSCGPSYFRGKGFVKLLTRSPIGLFVNGTDINMQFIHEDDVKSVVMMILNDSTVEGVFNLAPDSYATTKELSPNPKLFIKISNKTLKKIFSIIWKLRVAKVSPTSVDLLTYSIVISPQKIMERYNYKFKYSTKEAFYNSM